MEHLIHYLRETLTLAKLIGEAPVFLMAIRSLPAVVKGGAAVLLSGETGTGKELVARAIHYMGERVAFPFVPVNCGSLPDTLLEDELFGHERGAFTDAHQRRAGLIAQAEKGTLFLDEVDTLSAKAQVTLLRVLQDRRFRPIGSTREQQADVRVIAATNAPLKQYVRSGAFRADLYYRLCVFNISLPPLRERREDIPTLASHFLQKHALAEKPSPRLSAEARAVLMSFDWPGNVRELENAIIRGIHLSRSETIEVEDLALMPGEEKTLAASPLSAAPLSSFKVMKQEMIETFERDYLIRLMSEHQGNVSRAARTAGKERRELGKLLKKYHLNSKEFHATNNTTSP
ncbi:MAG TPA: sigma-54 dependent transcriptional regulator [Pyrinomonadaceae bacterium]